MKSEKIEISVNGEWLGYPVTLWLGENPKTRVADYQRKSISIIGWRYWNEEEDRP